MTIGVRTTSMNPETGQAWLGWAGLARRFDGGAWRHGDTHTAAPDGIREGPGAGRIRPQRPAQRLPADAGEPARPKRLFIVSAGNTPPEIAYTRLRAQDDFPIGDPAQAWNTLTI